VGGAGGGEEGAAEEAVGEAEEEAEEAVDQAEEALRASTPEPGALTAAVVARADLTLALALARTRTRTLTLTMTITMTITMTLTLTLTRPLGRAIGGKLLPPPPPLRPASAESMQGVLVSLDWTTACCRCTHGRGKRRLASFAGATA